MTRLREEVAVEVNLSLSATELDRRKYRQQFSQIYFCRLKQLMSSLRLAAQSKWLSSGMQEAIIVDRIIDLRPNQRSIIFGTIFVSLPNKPNVLKDLNGELSFPTLETPLTYAGGTCQVSIEDDSGRLDLEISNACSHFRAISGVCLSLLGCEHEDGVFYVEDFAYPGFAPSIYSRRLVAIISGLSLGANHNELAVDLLFDTLMGNIPSLEGNFHYQDICCVVFVGNSLSLTRRSDDSGKKRYGHEVMSYGLDSLTDFDRKLAALCQSVKTVVVPGPNDPTNSSWPQRSFKKGLFPKSSSCGDTHFLENPSWAVIDECKFLFSAGQNLDDMRRYDVTNDMLELAELCLRCRHIAPSAPDTLCISLQSH